MAMGKHPKYRASKDIVQGSTQHSKEIAIIGMACRVPGANHYLEFWNNLIHGINSIQEIPENRWSIKQYYSPDINEPNKSISKWGGFLDQIDQFDSLFLIFPRVKRKAWTRSNASY